MRTTLTLESDVMERLRREAALQKRPFKQVVNDTLRRGLGGPAPSRRKPYRVKPHSSAFVPGVDPARLNELAGELEAMEFRR